MNGTPVPFGGVVTVPQSSVHLDIQRHVAQMLEGVPEGRTMAVVSILTDKGLNLAVAHKFNQAWSTALWVGKSGWDKEPLAGGVTVSFSR